MTPELRLIRYFVAVAEERNFTRAAERLHMAQPPLSTAIRRLEQQLDVRLLERTPRQVELTAAGRLLLERGRELLSHADEVVSAVRAVEKAPTGLLRVGMSPAARFGVTPELLARWSATAPGVMVHAGEGTTGALLRDVRQGRLDLALAFCPTPTELAGLAHRTVRDDRVILYLRDDHPLAGRDAVALADLAAETLIVAGGPDSPGYTEAVIRLCRDAGVEPRTLPDPHPDLGGQAVREGLGVVLYVASAFSAPPEGSRLVPVTPGVTMPFVLAWRADSRSAALAAVLSEG
jgi:DNA-binding transcriptional LysR family regulator